MCDHFAFHDERIQRRLLASNAARLNRLLGGARCPVHGLEARVVPMDKNGWRFENTCCTELLKIASQTLANHNTAA